MAELADEPGEGIPVKAMVQDVLNRVKLRAIFVVLLIHAGLVSAVVGLSTLPRPDGMELAHWLTLGGLVAVYGGMVLGIFMVVGPLLSLVRKIRKLLRWRDWILDALPRIIAQLPSVLEAIRVFFQSQNQNQKQNKQGGAEASPSPEVRAPAPMPKSPPEAG